uniref:Uncharacterized protein n=1 Tax=Anguilla anguilla TaxID=7936 RepID=A0A0E9QSS5_ANGAN
MTSFLLTFPSFIYFSCLRLYNLPVSIEKCIQILNKQNFFLH